VDQKPNHSGEVKMKIFDELKFRLWGFSTGRVVVLLDALAFLYLLCAAFVSADKNLPDLDHGRIHAHLGAVSWLLIGALVFCFLPPYNQTKLYFCWPLTAFLMVVLLLLTPL
jgi:hypothetical protein